MNSGSADHLSRIRASYATCSVSGGNNTRSYGIGKKQLSLAYLKQNRGSYLAVLWLDSRYEDPTAFDLTRRLDRFPLALATVGTNMKE